MWRFGDFLAKEKVTRRRQDTPKGRFVLHCRNAARYHFNSFLSSINLSLKIAAYSNSSIFASAPLEASLRGAPVAISSAQAK